jgi:hypothetical protein
VGDKGLRLWLSALTVLWALTFAAVLALSRPETLQVRRLEVVNAKGKPIAVLGISPGVQPSGLLGARVWAWVFRYAALTGFVFALSSITFSLVFAL